MKNRTLNKKATYYLSTHPGVMTAVFALLLVFSTYMFRVFDDGSIQQWQRYFVYVLLVGGAAFYTFKWVHSVRFTSEGILFFRLGKEYRRVSWSDVVQVGLAKEYKASKLTLVITPVACPAYEDHTRSTTAYVEHYRQKLILLDGTKENQNAVRLFYGEMSYNAKLPNSKMNNGKDI